MRINQQPPPREGTYDPNRYRLHFERESKEQIEKRKAIARERILRPVAEADMEMDIDDIYPPERSLDFPRRPSWHYGMVREELLRKEEKTFQEFLTRLHSQNQPGSLSHFEHNLETWRQLWRVLEMSDVILLIVDIRYPVIQFPQALYNYVTNELHKQLILVLNKADLCPAPLVLAWREYLSSRFPSVHCICFTSHPGQPPSTVLQKKKRRKKISWSQVGGPLQIFRACQDIVAGRVDLNSWEQKIQRDASTSCLEEEVPDDVEPVSVEYQSDVAMEMQSSSHELYKDGVLTLGCVGFPNVGKSSVLNSLVGRKVVSVSRTPGHTKYFQTYFLTPTVKLCDCPGLVFPSLVNQQLQILAGIYPVSQLQEPYSSVGYLCERTPFQSVLKLRHPNQEGKNAGGEEEEWTAWDVCEAWAERRGYKTAKAARNDAYRAANSLLRLAIDGRICLCLRPPGYTVQKAVWESHPDLSEIITLQGRLDKEVLGERDEEEAESSSEPEEERNRDADEDDGDDEDDSLVKPAWKGILQAKLYANMFSILGENECE